MDDRLTVYPESGGSITLGPGDHLATGGEGAVYARGDRVYKVFLDPDLAVAHGMEGKLDALRLLAHPGIAAPQGALRDRHGRFIGLVLPRVAAEPLCRAFTNSWRDPNRYGVRETAITVDAMRAVTAYAHQHQALMVDANEMNWLLAGTQPTAIDVDSWQLPGFAATAIMPSIRDPAASHWDEGTDWFAWAIVTFQLWTGIHPYKGTHPDHPRAALEARMRARASVFDARVRLPGAARPVAAIPQPLRDWYARTFQTAERDAPPSTTAGAIGAQTAPRLRVRQVASSALRIERLGHAGGRILCAFDGFVVALGPGGLCLWDAVSRTALPQVTDAELSALLDGRAALLRTGFGRVLLLLDVPAGILRMRVVEDGQGASLPTAAQRLWPSGSRVFGVVPGVSNGLVEFEAARLAGGRPLLAVRHAWPVATLSTQLYRGVFLQDCLGAPFLGVPEGAGLLQAAAPRLRDYRVTDGFAAGPGTVWLAALRRRDGETVRLQLALAQGRFDVVDEAVVPEPELDAAANAAGVAVVRDGHDLLVAKGLAQKRLTDAGLPDPMRWFSLGPAGIGAWEDTEVMKVSLVP